MSLFLSVVKTKAQKVRRLFFKTSLESKATGILCNLCLDAVIGALLSSQFSFIIGSVNEFHCFTASSVENFSTVKLVPYIYKYTKDHDPLGFKLNAKLDTLFSQMIINILHLNNGLMSYVLKPVSTLCSSNFNNGAVLATIGFIFGLQGIISISFDVIRAWSLHIFIIHRVFSIFHRAQTSMLLTLGRLFQGKKYNTLRDRVDHAHFSHAQIILSSFLFITAIFLLKTTLLYYLAIQAVWLPVNAVLHVFKGLLVLLLTIPFEEGPHQTESVWYNFTTIDDKDDSSIAIYEHIDGASNKKQYVAATKQIQRRIIIPFLLRWQNNSVDAIRTIWSGNYEHSFTTCVINGIPIPSPNSLVL